MVRVIYLFTSISSASPNDPVVFNPNFPAANGYIQGFHQEGFYYMWKKLLEHKVVDEVVMVVESNRGTGSHKWAKNFIGLAIPRIEFIEDYIVQGDIIFVRGGFKSWYALLQKLSGKHWILFYRAATNRGAWPFWDVVLDDLRDRPFSDGRNYIPFTKPINEDIFKKQTLPIKYDLMLGASHVHDKKAQWKATSVVEAYQGRLNCILPGKFIGGQKTNNMWPAIKKLGIETPGCLTRDEMANLYPQCKLMVHLGAAGQNDRGPLESFHCGTPVLLANPRYHAPFMNKCCFVTEHGDNFEAIAKDIHDLYLPDAEKYRQQMHDNFMEHSKFELTTLLEMQKLFSILSKMPIPNRTEFMKAWTSTNT